MTGGRGEGVRRRLRKLMNPGAPELVDLLVVLARDTAGTLSQLHDWAAAHVGESVGAVDESLRTAAALAREARRTCARRVAEVFILPLDPEEILELSERLEAVINAAYLLQREAVVLELRIEPELVDLLGHAAQMAADLPRAVGSLASRTSAGAVIAESILDRRWDAEEAYAELIRARSRAAVPGAPGPAQREIARRAEDLIEAVAHAARRIVHTIAKRA